MPSSTLDSGTFGPVTKSLKFPSNLSDQYYMTLSFYKYERQNLNSQATTNPQFSVKLPIPANMIDSQSVDYSEEALGTAIGVAAESLSGWAAARAGAGVAETAATMAVGGGAAALLGGAGALSQTGTNAALGAMGVTANPFLTVMFKNPKYRTYDFSWRFFPRSASESESARKIYQLVKHCMLPDRYEGLAGGVLLTYPMIVQPTLYSGNSSWVKYKKAVITNAAFNIAPDGVPSFHVGGEPSSIDMRISFQEVEYFLSKDYPVNFSFS